MLGRRMVIGGLFVLGGAFGAAAQVAGDAGRPEQGGGGNRLSKSSSPYLRQHRFNPVDWHPWGEEALALAKRLDKPIFLSIGYSACHWCHVMARESFSDPTVAQLMNDKFVCIKVDREERPDIDQIYMGALQAMGKQGGWPLSAWLTPEGRPFYGGTYFPPEATKIQPGFRQVCESIAKAWVDDHDEVVAVGGDFAAYLERALAPELVAGEPTVELFGAIVTDAQSWFDPEVAGFAGPPRFAPKFPQVAQLQMLLGHPNGEAREMACAALDAMHRGGIQDQLGGGFHRYSTDRRWLVPHFEKMLYDNALLSSAYFEAGLMRADRGLHQTGLRTLDYLLREMQAPEGGFWSSQDAQSEGVEGRFFVWQQAELEELLGADAAEFCATYGVTKSGNWDGKNVLALVGDRPTSESFQRSCQRALAARKRRARPSTDHKILVAWNGFAVEAFCDGYRAAGDARYLAAAQSAGRFLLRRCFVEDRVRRSWQGGAAPLPGYLDDHGSLSNALLSLFECDGDPQWLRAAVAALRSTVLHFSADDGSFYYTADDHEQLVARSKTASEGATPSGVALVARALLRAGLLLADEELYARGVAVLRAHHGALSEKPSAVASLMRAAQLHLAGPREVVVTGSPDDERTVKLLEAAWRHVPRTVVVTLLHAGNREALEAISPVFEAKREIDGRPCAYVCRRGVCEAPLVSAEQLRRALGSR